MSTAGNEVAAGFAGRGVIGGIVDIVETVDTADIVHTIDTLDIVKSVNSVDNVSSIKITKIHQNSSKIIKIHQKQSKNDKNPRTPYLILGKVYFSRGKGLCAAPETPRNIHQESNLPPLAPLGSQAGGLTTRPDLYGPGDGNILANLGKIIEIWEMVK